MPFRLFLTLTLVLPLAAAEVTLWQFLHPEAKILVGLEVQKARLSPTVRMFERQLKSLPGAKFNSGGTEMFALVDRLLFSSPGSLQAASPSMLIAIEGRMDRNVLKKALAEGMAVERFKGVDLLLPPRQVKSDIVVAILSEKHGLMGDRPTVEAAILAFQAGSGPVPDNKLLARAAELSAKYDFWMTTSAPPRELAGGMLPGPASAQDVEAMEMGLSFQRGLGLQMVLTMADAESAKRVLAQINGPRPGVPLPPGLISDLVNGLRARADKNTLRIDLDIPLARLEKGVQEFKTQMAGLQSRSLESLLGIGVAAAGPALLAGMQPAAVSPAVRPAPAPPAAPQKRTIRIVGLDSGEKEITYTTGAKPAEPR